MLRLLTVYLSVKVSKSNTKPAGLSLLITFCITLFLYVSARGQQNPAGNRVEDFSLPAAAQKKLEVSNVPKSSLRDLVNDFARLTESQKHDLGPLTDVERRELLRREGTIELREKVGVVRPLPAPLQVTGLTRTIARERAEQALAGGKVQLTADGRLVWTTEISSTGATGIRVEIKDIDLPREARIFVTDGVTQVYGPYTPRDNQFWTNTVFGSTVYIQVQIPRAAADRSANAFTINQIAHIEMSGEPALGYRLGGGELPAPLDFSMLVTCSIQSFCRPAPPPPVPSPEDTLLETASLGVAHIEFVDGGGVFICSGGLLSDRQGSNTPFFLTAHHCLSSQASATSLEAYFRYRRVCGQPVPSLSSLPRTLGSTLLATSATTDFTMVQLSQRPPDGSHFFRWTTEDISSTTTTIYRIHHPSGFSQHVQMSVIGNPDFFCGGLPPGNFLYSSPQRGGTLPGSSGSLIFRANGTTPEVVGQLFGACSADPPACGYWNVDGAFANTYPNVRQFLDNVAPGPGPVVNILRPEDNATLPAHSDIEIVASITDTAGVATAELYWQKTNHFLPCPGTNNADWRCTKLGNEYKWTISVGAAGPRQYHLRTTNSLGNQTIIPSRTINLH